MPASKDSKITCTNAARLYAAAIKIMQQVEHDCQGQDDKLAANKELVQFADDNQMDLELAALAYMFKQCVGALLAAGFRDTSMMQVIAVNAHPESKPIVLDLGRIDDTSKREYDA